jgi:hypothetical protein
VFGVKEGDTPSFLYLIRNGLGDPERPGWGSWGGRFSGTGPRFTDAKDHWRGGTSERATVFRWREAYQNSFAARMNWCIRPRDQANHPPIAVLDGPRARTVQAGSRVELIGKSSRDPDGHAVSFDWSFLREAGSFDEPLTIEDPDQPVAHFIAPDVESPRILHFLLSVTDGGSPPLTSYERVIVMVAKPTPPE